MQITQKIFVLPLLYAALILSTHSYAKSLNDVIQDPNALLFNISGSNTIGAHLAPAWAMQYLIERKVDDVKIISTQENESRVEGQYQGATVFINIFAHGSSTGFKSMHNNSADVAMASRPIKAAENIMLSTSEDLRTQANEHVVAIDGLAIIVNKNNPINEVSLSQLRDIFSGKIKNWRQIGGTDSPILVHARDDKSGTWDTFKSLVLDANTPLYSRATRFESNDELAASVARQRNAVGFVALASVNDTKTLAVADGKSLKLIPQHLTIATEDYPLSRRLYMYTMPEKTNAVAHDFVTYTKSQSGQEIVETIGFISQNPLSIAGTIPEEVPQGYANLVQNGERLSINFRFETGSAELDNKAKQDVYRLAEFMKLPQNKNKRIQLIGFGDFKQRETLALAFSKMRALAVKSALHKEGILVEPVKGFGSFLPVASNEGENKMRNQRVEVWLFNGDNDAHPPTLESDPAALTASSAH